MGGIVGFLNNQDMTGANYKTEIYQSYVANGHITAPTNVGGLIGRIAEPIYDSRYYRSNYIEAYLNSSTIEVSMGIGSDERENSKIERLYVYENSKINNQIIEKGSNYIPVNNYLKDEDLSKESTYRNKIGFSSYYNYSKLKQGKYPLLTGERGIITPQEGIDIPNSQNRTKNLATTLALTSKNTTPKEQLPKIKIYPVDVNEINVELDKIGNNLKLYYNDGTEKTNEIDIKEKVYTFKYDFKTNIKLNLTDGISTIAKEIKPTEVANTISILNDKTYYLETNKIKTQGEELQGEFVNIYFDKALSNEGKIYDITKQKWEEGITKGFLLQEKVKPKEESEYKGTKISTFANFTTMQKGNLKTQKQGRVLVRNNKLSLTDNNIETNKENEIINEYNGKEYQTILGKDKKLYDIKTPLKYPKEFINKNIEEIATEDTEKQQRELKVSTQEQVNLLKSLLKITLNLKLEKIYLTD